MPKQEQHGLIESLYTLAANSFRNYSHQAIRSPLHTARAIDYDVCVYLTNQDPGTISALQPKGYSEVLKSGGRTFCLFMDSGGNIWPLVDGRMVRKKELLRQFPNIEIQIRPAFNEYNVYCSFCSEINKKGKGKIKNQDIRLFV